MKKSLKTLSVLSAAAVLSTSLECAAFAEDAGAQLQKYHTMTSLSDGVPSEYGYVNFRTVDENGNEIDPNAGLSGSYTTLDSLVLPSKYSMVDEGYLPAVRNQGTEGSCWAHAGMTMAESSLIKQGYESASSVDFSEKHLAWFAMGTDAPEGDPLHGDFSALGAPKAFSAGGNMDDVMFTLMSWTGVDLESDVPYGDFENGVDESHRYHSYAHLRNVNEYADDDISSIKQAIMNDGAVQIAYYANNQYLTKNNDAGFAAYYCPTNYTSNHSITVVGWDDDFSKSNFTAGGTPESDGAWLCRNSWGPTWGTDGYFYMSYENVSLTGFASLTMDTSDNYEKIYQYDGGCIRKDNGQIASWKSVYSPGIKGAANVFTVSEDENLSAVSFYTPLAGSDYRIEVYTDLTGNTPDTGTLVSEVTTSGVSTYSGYHTVDLSQEVLLKAGTKFAVSVDISASDGEHYVFTDISRPSAELSYFSDSGKWRDTADYYDSYGIANVRIKAYTKKAPGKIENVKAVSENGKVSLTWDAVNGASKYRVRRNSGSGWTTLATVSSTSYVDEAPVAGTNQYIVIPYINDSFATEYQSDAVTATVNAEAVVLTVKAQENNVTVTWNTVSGATKYRIRRNDGTGWTTLQTSAKTSYVDTTALKGKRYTYVVYPFINGSFGAPSVTVKAALVGGSGSAAVTVVTTDGKAVISWDKIDGVKKYRVRRNDGTKWQTMASTANLSWTDSSIESGKTYTYVVYISADGTNYSNPSSTITSRP